MYSISKIFILNCLLLTAGIPTARAGEMTPAKASSQDGLFVGLGLQGGMTEIETSEIAKDRSKNADVLAIADQMIKDHKLLIKKTSKDAKDADVYVPCNLDKGHQQEVDQLKDVSDADFDKAYLEIQDKEHREAVMSFKEESTMGMNTALVTDAKEGLPIVTDHQVMIQGAEKRMAIQEGLLPSMADKPAKVVKTH